MSRYHVCVRNHALHFGAERIEEAMELARHLRRQGRDVEIVDNLTGREVTVPAVDPPKPITATH